MPIYTFLSKRRSAKVNLNLNICKEALLLNKVQVQIESESYEVPSTTEHSGNMIRGWVWAFYLNRQNLIHTYVVWSTIVRYYDNVTNLLYVQ